MNTATLPAEFSKLREPVVTLKVALELSRQENSLLRQKMGALGHRVFSSSSQQRRLWEKILPPFPNCNAVENHPPLTP